MKGRAALLEWVRGHVGHKPERVEQVQVLWSGYGEILRLFFPPDTAQSLVVKTVDPPSAVGHPRGFGGSRSHERKLRSYAVEQAFYQHYAPLCIDGCRVPASLALETTEAGWRFLLEDLDSAGFPGRRHAIRDAELDACLRWLASFHASFLGQSPLGLWDVGTYWHLATRPDELAAMEDNALREAAPILDAALSDCRYRTLVHGDAKIANFCFGPKSVAAVDFQYVGGGCGMKDVAYFLGSCLSSDKCESEGDRHLNSYFRMLRSELADSDNANAIDVNALESEWRSLYPAAWADFHRFLAGWAPDHSKIHAYAERMTREALATL